MLDTMIALQYDVSNQRLETKNSRGRLYDLNTDLFN